mmetsp:Transcript_20870/g.34936  ORF Transcript_20870/g.34936 Transcript_20870/m.34936 type:complete len:244 (+) Transcript_20870:255-986(+)|eukprot:CAMPEP_0198212186 /NCGR_PEP_ID=MMETSP1445-20131203/25573_1 /TAXON_ID=36898 /ORGANISM="Pyramimonas sp., Strain CCMP2087" /LENGTH=243 /DNA_ID=CAMNT_0043886581 /DNA_START=231 /DNA_END=962 /DNA_ORIENTATION=-
MVAKGDPTYLGPVSASPQICSTEMLNLAEVTSRDVVYDLGCGDGRVVITAARERRARGVGVELDDKAVGKARDSVIRENVSDLVQILHQDVFEVDVSEATVVFLYLLPKGNQSVAKKLLAELRPGTRIVTYIFKMDATWVPYLEKVQPVSSSANIDTTHLSKLHLYRIPDKGTSQSEASKLRTSEIAASADSLTKPLSAIPRVASRNGNWERNVPVPRYWSAKKVALASTLALCLSVLGRVSK